MLSVMGGWSGFKRTGDYWTGVVVRALADTFRDSPLNNFFKIALWLAPLIAALVAWQVGELPPPVYTWVGAGVYVALFLLVVIYKLTSIPALLAMEADDRHIAEIAKLTAERDTALAKAATPPPRDEKFDYALFFTVDMDSKLGDPPPMEWALEVRNTRAIPVQFQSFNIDLKFRDEPKQRMTCKGSVLRASTSTYFRFPCPDSTRIKDGVLDVALDVSFGPPGANPTRRLLKVMQVKYNYRHAITESVCANISEAEETLTA